MKKIIFLSFFVSLHVFASTNYSAAINAAFEKEEEAVCNTTLESEDIYSVACKNDSFESQYDVTLFSENEIIGSGDAWTATNGGYCSAEGKINIDGTAKVKTRCTIVQD